MLASVLQGFFFDTPPRASTAPEPPPRRSTPVFIGDAVQPLGQDTLLLEIMRRDAARRDDQP